MNKRHSIGKLIVSALLVSVLAACSTPGETSLVPEAIMTAESGVIPSTGGDIDELFINMMVPHHEGALEMARIAQERSQRPEILEMADAIIASQSEEIAQMKTWKQTWYGSSDTPDMSEMPMLMDMPGMGDMGHTMDMQADVDALRNAAEPFDLAFINAMIVHHQSAIDAANVVLNSAVHPEIKEMASQIIDAQQAEIDQMKEWRAQWFPDAPAP